LIILKRAAPKGGFTLVELLLVIVLVAILMALITLSGFSMVESSNAQTEARRIIRTVHALRSAWLACYADTQEMVGIPAGSWPSNTVNRTLARYSDRSLTDEETRYGQITIKVNPPGHTGTYIGFATLPNASPPKTGAWGRRPIATNDMIMKSLTDQTDDYGLIVHYSSGVRSASNDVYIRIR